jgi:diguanylate cyclase (GGDEF)-like protein
MLLKAYFRDNDHVIRYAGDEFVIVMENTTDKEIDVIGARIDHINLRLKNTEDGVPPLSLSAGIAFSDTGYYEALFNQADKALYQAKTNGRCGYTVYTQDIDILHP